MKTIYQLFLSLVILLSCKSEKQKLFEKDILGEWNFAKYIELQKQDNKQIIEEPPSPFFRNEGGFVFNEDGTLIDEAGFFDLDEGKSREEQRMLYKGDSTNYKIVDDSLKIFNPIKKCWNKYKIISISKDTLTLKKNEGYYLKYYKPNYKLNLEETFDKIIISSSGCYGTCPIMNIEFNKNGKVFYLGEKYNTVNGFYTSNISKSEYESIENSFKKADINELEDSYSAPFTDGNTITISFIRNNKIIKTISDYGSEGPSKLIFAYRKAMFKYQQVKLSSIKLNKEFIKSTMFGFSKNGKLFFMEQSEHFLLLNEILRAKKVDVDFKKKYKLTFYDDIDTKSIIETDGRFYKYQNDIYDIGYNFISLNNLEKTLDY